MLKGHVGSVVGIGFGIDGTTLYTSAADGSIMLWDIAGAGGVARRVTEPDELATGFTGTVWISPTADGVTVAGLSNQVIDLEDGDLIELRSDPSFETQWAAYSSDGERFVAVNTEGALRLWNVADGDHSRRRLDAVSPTAARSRSPQTARPSSLPTPTAS